MNCTEVRGYLSEYMDEVLDERMKDLVEKHLTTCKACRQELASLRSLAGELRETGRLKAPEDFLETLHARLSRDSWWTRVKRILFVPAQIKIPLEFATACVAAVIIFSLYSSGSPDRRQGPGVEDLVLEGSGRSNALRENAPQAMSRQPVMAPAEVAGDGKAARLGPVELVMVLRPPHRGGGTGAFPGEKGVSEAGDEHSPSAMKGSAAVSEGSAADATLRKSGEDTARLDAKTDRANASEEQDFENGARAIAQRVEDAVGLFGGTILSEGPDPEHPKELVILGEIPAARYQDFSDHLAMLAEMEGPVPKAPVREGDGVLVRIRLRSP